MAEDKPTTSWAVLGFPKNPLQMCWEQVWKLLSHGDICIDWGAWQPHHRALAHGHRRHRVQEMANTAWHMGKAGNSPS